VNVLKPEVIFALPGINPELRSRLIKELIAKSGYIHLDVDFIIKNAVERGTELGKKFELQENEEGNVIVILEQLKRILFNNPNNKKFVITNLSSEIEHFLRFESEVCPINKVLTFLKRTDLSDQNTYVS